MFYWQHKNWKCTCFHDLYRPTSYKRSGNRSHNPTSCYAHLIYAISVTRKKLDSPLSWLPCATEKGWLNLGIQSLLILPQDEPSRPYLTKDSYIRIANIISEATEIYYSNLLVIICYKTKPEQQRRVKKIMAPLVQMCGRFLLIGISTEEL